MEPSNNESDDPIIGCSSPGGTTELGLVVEDLFNEIANRASGNENMDGGRKIDKEKRHAHLRKYLVDGFKQVFPRPRILHDILVGENGRESVQNHQDLFNRGYKGAIFAVCIHNDHFHIVHDCQYTNSHCRCAIINVLRTKFRRVSRKCMRTVDFSIEHWVNLVLYFDKEGRKNIKTLVAGIDWFTYNKNRNISDERLPEDGHEELVETCSVQELFHCAESNGPEVHSSRSNDQEASTSTSKQPKYRSKGDRIIQFIYSIPTAPINNIYNTSEWINGPYKFMSLSDKLLISCMKIVKHEYIQQKV